MSTNRHLINNNELVHAPVHLERGWTVMFGFGNSFVVNEGQVAVITEGGAYVETLFPGTHALSRFATGRELKAILVEAREMDLTVSTSREFTIARPVPVTIDLDVSVTYRVSDFRRVACEVKYPLLALYDEVINAIRSAVSYATYDEIRVQGEGIAATTLARLKSAQLQRVIGIEVLNVRVVRLRSLDTAGDALAGQALKEYTKVRDWMVDNQITANSQVTWPWLVVNRPEVAKQLLQMYGSMAEKMIESGALSTSNFLNQTIGGQPAGINDPLLDLSLFGLPTSINRSISSTDSIPASDSKGLLSPRTQQDFLGRMREEVSYLKSFSGAQVDSGLIYDAQGVPNGFAIQVKISLKMGGELVLYFACTSSYPSSKPDVAVEVDGSSAHFDSEILRKWSGQYLVEIVREAKKWFEY